MRKRSREMDRLAARHGFAFVRYTGSGHRQYRHPDGRIVVGPSTCGGGRGLRNFAAQLRRSGDS